MLAELDSLDLHTLRLDYQKTQNEFELSGKLLEALIPAAKAGSVPGQRLVEAENTHDARCRHIPVALFDIGLNRMHREDRISKIVGRIKNPCVGILFQARASDSDR